MAAPPAVDAARAGGHARRVRQHDGHLQDDLELVADGVGGERVEALRAVAGLEEERLARGNVAGVQFHPEKSQAVGLDLLARFLEWRP